MDEGFTHTMFCDIAGGRPGDLALPVARMYPLQGGWTEEDFFRLDLACGFELTDGILSCRTLSTLERQLTVQYIFKEIRTAVERDNAGYVFFRPFIVRLAPGVLRQPDIVYLRRHRIVDVHTPPQGADLIIEIVAPNADKPWQKRIAPYANAGVSEYWIVDPLQQCICVLALEGNEYKVAQDARLGQTARSIQLPDLKTNVEKALKAAGMYLNS